MSLTLHTSHGDLKIELENFLALAASGSYDNTKFHRNVAKFMIQGGDPTGTGKGGEAIDGGYLDDEIVDTLRHSERGIVAMANRGSNTNGSQFYITYGPMPSLDGHSSIIGRVVDGLSTLDAMERVPVKGKKCRPLQDIVLQCVTIHANPIAQEEVPAAES